MRSFPLFALLILTTLPTPSAAAPKPEINDLGWIQGVWTGVKNGVAFEETWSSPAGGNLIGMHRESKDGSMTSFEFFRVVPSDSGGVCYLSSPMGQAPTRFCAIELTASRVVFENREHDFPQRVMYWLEKDGRLHARIEGTIRGSEQSEDWVWTRAPRR